MKNKLPQIILLASIAILVLLNIDYFLEAKESIAYEIRRYDGFVNSLYIWLGIGFIFTSYFTGWLRTKIKNI